MNARLASRLVVALVLSLAVGTAAASEPTERRLYPDTVDASSFLWGDWNRFIENYHPNYVGDDDPKTAWVEGSPGSGAGQWLRLQVTPLEGTTRVRLKVRNGYQKSKALFAANARAKDVVVRLLPSKVETKATLTDVDGWQELTVAQPSGPMRAIELKIGSVYEGTKYQDLCVSDVQVFATATTPDNPTFEKSKKKALLAWRAARLAAAKAYGGGKVALPLHPSYQITTTDRANVCSDCDLADMIAAAAADPDFKDWQAALALGKTVVAELDTLPQAQLAPRSKTKLPLADGFERPELDQLAGSEGPWYSDRVLRLPVVTAAAIMNAGDLRVLDVKRTRTPQQFAEANDRRCKKDAVWVKRLPAAQADAPAQVRALVVGTCGMVEARDGYYPTAALQLVIYDADGRAVVVVSGGAIDAYRWATEDGRPMISGGHALLGQGSELDAVKIAP
ncbi:MAG: hypothetical protein IPL61_31390 [Myxococcales bacterium]|nr:hypothetical protein [Myxococcales bacterium]